MSYVSGIRLTECMNSYFARYCTSGCHWNDLTLPVHAMALETCSIKGAVCNPLTASCTPPDSRHATHSYVWLVFSRTWEILCNSLFFFVQGECKRGLWDMQWHSANLSIAVLTSANSGILSASVTQTTCLEERSVRKWLLSCAHLHADHCIVIFINHHKY
jgi:hypothetical protein